MTSSPDRKLALAQLNFGIHQAIKSSRGAYIATPVIAIYLAEVVHSTGSLIWLILMFLTLITRNRWLRRAAVHPHDEDGQKALQLFTASSLALAVVIGMLPAWAMPLLPLSHKFFFTTVLCLWLAAAMASLGVLPRLFLGYTALVGLGLGIGWLRSGDDIALAMALLIATYLGVLTSFSRNFSKLVAHGVQIRQTNERLVEELRLANEAKSRFILTASHDLRQPLHALSLFSSAIQHDDDPQQMKTALRGIQKSVHALSQLFSVVLDLSKMDARTVVPHLRPLFLPELLSRLSQEYGALCQEKGLGWESQFAPVTIKTDPVLLERVLRNLLSNAVKHANHGFVGLGVSLGRQLSITVTDQGPGIPESEREHVFAEFYRLPHSRHTAGLGLGLGLSIVRRIVDLLGYGLEIDHADAQKKTGTRFHLEIPLSAVIDTAEAQLPSRPAPLESELEGLSVLVIDDDPEIVQATLLLLRQWGCRAEGADSLPGFLSQASATTFRPDVALIDNDCGTGTNTLALALAVAARWPEAGILLISGQAEAEVLTQLRKSGYPLLEKPVDPRELREVLEMFHRLS